MPIQEILPEEREAVDERPIYAGERETLAEHGNWCIGCPICWTPEIAEQVEWERGI